MTSLVVEQVTAHARASHRSSIAGWIMHRRPWFDYLTILLLQLSRIWGFWKWRDVAGGDESFYFVSAYSWFRHGKLHFLYSPIYTSFWGSLLHLTDDIATASVMHRALIVLALSVLVLSVMRSLLPSELAWLAAAWWAVVPINFDTAYAVHLFALFPILLTWLVVLRWRGPWSRGTAIALMLIAMFLVRNEMVISVIAVGLVLLGWEIMLFRADGERTMWSWLKLGGGYVVPALLAASVIVFYYHHSTHRGKMLTEQVHAKHVMSMGQAYGLGYAEHHKDWGKNPWTAYLEATRNDFGKPEPTLGDMLRQNPRALLRHMLWNARLLPASIQLLLFDETSDPVNPDVAPQKLSSRQALVLSLIVAAIALGAFCVGWRRRQFWRQGIATQRALAWMVIVASVAFTAPVILLLRPRPAYLFSLSLLAMAVIATCLHVIVGRWAIWRKMSGLMLPVMLLLPLAAPGHYGDSHVHNATPLADAIERLRPFAPEFQREGVVFVGSYPVEMQNYLGQGRGLASGVEVLAETNGKSFAEKLDEQKVNLLYINAEGWKSIESAEPGSFNAFLTSLGAGEWEALANEREPGLWWVLLKRRPPGATGVGFPTLLTFSGGSNFLGWQPVEGFQPLEGPYPRMRPPVGMIRWGDYPVSRLKTSARHSGAYTLRLSGFAPMAGQTMRVELDGTPIGIWPMQAGAFTDIAVPMNLSPGTHQVALTWSSFQAPDPVNNPQLRQALLFRELLIAEDKPSRQ